MQQPPPPPAKIHILLVDGRKLLRQGQSALLEKEADLEVVAEADDARAAARLLNALCVDVVVFNVSISTRDAADTVARFVAARPKVRVLVLSLSHEPTFVRGILGAGAAGCLTKECEVDELVGAIRAATAGQVYLSPAVADSVVSGYVLPPHRAARGKALSARERQILQGIADGRTTKELALALDVSTKTIETYRRRIMEKLDKHTVAELTKYAVREGLSSLESHHT
jgi:DNA-binding NarL/FixJ family response regulator